MSEIDWATREANRTLTRLLPRLDPLLAQAPEERALFVERLQRRFKALFVRLLELYGREYDFFWYLERILMTIARAHVARSPDLRALDRRREADEEWLLDHRHIGAVCYVNRFAHDLQGLRRRLPYLRELGITYLHLMPLFRSPPGDNDGGYAVSSYRELEPAIGTMEELQALATDMREQGISLVLDFVLNHTADDHPWALAARRGDPDAQAFYFMFDDRRGPERYLPMLREIFPERGGDAFVWRDDVKGRSGGKYVWSTFYPFQWDLNYRNPAVFDAILGEMMFLANQGVEVLRLDAVPFLWKAVGTTCENQPEAHLIVQALNAATDIAAPALTFKSEAIVHPDEVARYVDPSECHLSYNPLFMVLLWEALATRDTRLMRHCLSQRHATTHGTTWINYVRSHDDIGWGFANEDARQLGLDPDGHRAFLNAFYTGRFAGSFARGLPFQENPRTGDCRICGTTASLAGVEHALATGDERECEYAIRRVLLFHGLIMTIGGIPLIYLGDEIAQLNDYGFAQGAGGSADARWVHRPFYADERLAKARRDRTSPEGRVLAGLQRLIQIRKREGALSGNALSVLESDDRYLIAFERRYADQRLVVIGNLSEHQVEVASSQSRDIGQDARFVDLLDDHPHPTALTVTVAPYGFHVLKPLS